MQYQISRNGQMYGPYTREDLERYVSTGNVLPTDLAKNESMTEWLPVSEILAAAGTQSAPSPFSQPGSLPGTHDAGAYQPFNTPPAYAQPAYPAAYGTGLQTNLSYPDPPSLSWGLVLLADIFTLGLFQLFWNIYISLWLKKVRPNANTPLLCYSIVAVLGLLAGGLAIPIFSHLHDPATVAGAAGSSRLVGLISFIVKLVARFSYRNELQAQYGVGGPENMGVDVNPILLFFFGGLCLQSQLSSIARAKAAARLNGR